MRKLIAMMLLAAVSIGAAAEWVEKGRGQNFILYADPTSIRARGNRVKMWTLIDYNTTQTSESGRRFRSTKMEHEYYCDNSQIRLLFISQHSGNMGQGREVFSFSFSNAERGSRTDSNNESLWKAACADH